ncbi:chemotaxis protein CheB [Rhizobium sp. P38BS-XIX]|uniref:chemotaxis protein CheB n=1 Tax=Rhizobium sp. P38BS-XIX TaxID=2726740 RepID=UPI0014571D11|nr:chemotaxis protein CheB [Rhizobium sp. P38BS-XIX]NLR98057.1 chemotaxis protein CheB [Rhizobium sp. P38BS-XIX]
MSQIEAVVIGASAGALEALSVILPALPADFRVPIIVVVHIPPDKRSVLAELFASKCVLRVIEAEDKEPIRSGSIYFAPPDYHLLVEVDKSIALSSDEPELFSRPSIDVLFETAAEAYGPALIGIILTGANEDGAKGLKAVADAGGIAIAQDPEEAFQNTMPKAAIDAVSSAHILPLASITSFLREA